MFKFTLEKGDSTFHSPFLKGDSSFQSFHLRANGRMKARKIRTLANYFIYFYAMLILNVCPFVNENKIKLNFSLHKLYSKCRTDASRHLLAKSSTFHHFS